MLDARSIRQTFLDYFKEQGHAIVPSAPLVIKNDPTLMFTNAGMNQFKDYFLGNKPAPDPRVADTQKCLRVSGKHNDLEDVGLDTYHHTLFEMLGNWSFGDYFKKEAIDWSWDLLVNRFKLDTDSLYATVFGGDEKEGLERDMESFELWKKYLPEDRILFGSKKDNFWEMGDQGPCGPCTEIHYDMRPKAERDIPGRDLVNNDHPQVIEIWNNVFMEFNRLANGSLEKLPAQHVDTGMGFERLVRAIQNKQSNYDTDVFTPLLDKIAQLSGLTYGQDEKTDIAFRVVADHIRAISFAITDGQLPGNAKAGYVIRRILRRAVRYGYSFLGQKKPFLHHLVPVLAQQFAGVFDELRQQQDFVARCIYEEEAGFLRTLESGIRKFEALNLQAGGVVDGAVAFELYDTFGFPLDLTALLAREAGLTIDEAGFNAEMEKQKERSRKAGAVSYGDWQDVKADVVSQFVGYDTLTCPTEVQRVRMVESKGEQFVQVVLADSPFYAESGGQVGDSGQLVRADNPAWVIPVLDTKKENDLQYVLVGEEYHAWLLQPGVWTATVDAARRGAIASNHTATHLLHAALRQVLGTHVQQKGSLVSEKELRFDFSHPAKVSDEELAVIENIVNDKIAAAIPLLEERYVPIARAQEKGAMALFGEKYGDVVRVITFDPKFSVELCGGTHVRNTQEIRLCKLTAEGSVAAGVRRISAVTAEGALEYLNAGLNKLEQAQGLFKGAGDIAEQISRLLEENTALKNRLKELEAASLTQIQSELSGGAQVLGPAKLIAAVREVSAESAKSLVFELGKTHPDAVVILGSVSEGKPLLSIYAGTTVQELAKVDARAIVKIAGSHIQGGGGGQAFYATAGGKNAEGIHAAVEAAAQAVKEALA